MMKKIILLIFLTLKIISSSQGQCNVTVKVDDAGFTSYSTQKEKIYTTPRIENGVFFAHIAMDVWQGTTDYGHLQIMLLVWVVREPSQPLVVPRMMTIKFSDNTSLNLVAETEQNPRDMKGATAYSCIYTLTTDMFSQIQKKSISKFEISDNRSGNNITCTPYVDLLKEQANCIAKRLKVN